MIPFSPPRIDDKIIEAVVDVLKSTWITTGPKTAEFEEELKKYTNCKEVICLNSASAGLELVLRWFGVGSGDEVICPHTLMPQLLMWFCIVELLLFL